MKDYLVFPLLSMVGELQRRQEELFKILKKKDYEIQEYKNAGAVLPRSKSLNYRDVFSDSIFIQMLL